MTKKSDIQSSEDIKKLVDAFYAEVRADDVMGPIFDEVAKVDWAHHLPRMYAFWDFLLLDAATYQGNPIEPHHRLAAHFPLSAEHFDRWLAMFKSAVDDNFEGEIAEKAKFKAYAIAETWKPKFTGTLR